MAMPLSSATHHPRSGSFLKPLTVIPSRAGLLAKTKSRNRVQVQASVKGKAVTGLTAVALSASIVIPQVAEAAGPGVSHSLENFLLSIASGGVVVAAIVGAVIGVSNFDPVKRS